MFFVVVDMGRSFDKGRTHTYINSHRYHRDQTCQDNLEICNLQTVLKSVSLDIWYNVRLLMYLQTNKKVFILKMLLSCYKGQ